MQLQTIARNAAANALADLCDVGSTNSTARIIIYTSGKTTTLAEVLCNNPAFGAAANGVVTLDVSPDVQDTAANATGTAALYDLVDRDNNIIISGNVGTTGTDLIVANTSFQENVPIRITSLIYTVPAGSLGP